MTDDRQISVEMLLAKIGQLVVQLEIANNDIVALRNQLAELKKSNESNKESTAEK